MVLGGIITCIFVSVILFLFSFVIWKKKDLSFVAGYNEQTFSGDKNKLANAVGAFLMISAVLTLILPFALEFIGAIAGILFATILITGIIGLVIYIKFINKWNITIIKAENIVLKMFSAFLSFNYLLFSFSSIVCNQSWNCLNG